MVESVGLFFIRPDTVFGGKSGQTYGVVRNFTNYNWKPNSTQLLQKGVERVSCERKEKFIKGEELVDIGP